MYTKKELRSIVRKRRKELLPEQAEENSHRIAALFTALPEYKRADCILAYIDYNHEVSTRQIIQDAWTKGKRVAAPRVEGEEMNFYYISSFEQLENGYMGIPEPDCHCEQATEPAALMIMPGVAFDRKLHRCGYGKGYYDRYLEKHTRIIRAAVAYEFQIFDQVPAEEFDQFPHILITEKEILHRE